MLYNLIKNQYYNYTLILNQREVKMTIDILNQIKKDLKQKIKSEEIENLNIFSLHHGVCLYIRNKYLWKNPIVLEELKKYFNTDDVDELSFMILEFIKTDLD